MENAVFANSTSDFIVCSNKRAVELSVELTYTGSLREPVEAVRLSIVEIEDSIFSNEQIVMIQNNSIAVLHV